MIPCDVPDDAVALVDEDGGALSWGALRAGLAHRSLDVVDGLVFLRGTNRAALVLDLLAARARGHVPVLIPPRFPAALERDVVVRVRAGFTRVDAAARAALADVTFTSGSTGTPRAIAHTHDGHAHSARGAHARLPFGPGDRWLLSLPLCHVGGLGVVARAELRGGALVLPRPGEPLSQALLRTGATHVSVVRAQLVDLLGAAERPRLAAQLRAVVVGGGPTPSSLLEDAVRAGLPVAQTWGMTETHAMIATSAIGRPSTCGPPLPGREVRVDGEGVLWVRGPVLAAGALDERGLTPLPTDADGWFCTGDLGVIDVDGCVTVTGRVGLRFVSGGEKIEPEAIERALLDVPGVQDVVVVPVPHPRWGHRPVAFVRRNLDGAGGRPPSDEDLAAQVRARLPSPCVPDAWLPWPADVEGKPDRALLRARAVATLQG